MGSRRRSVAGAAAVALVVAGCGGSSSSSGSHDAVTTAAAAFLHDWSTGDLAAAAAATTDPTSAQSALQDFQSRIVPSTRTFTTGAKNGCGDNAPCTVAFGADLQLQGLGEWRYQGSLGLVQQTAGTAKKWVVQWAPSVIHPQLTATTMITRKRSLPDRAPILDRFGSPVVSNQTVKRIGVTAGSVPDGVITNLATLLNLDVDGLNQRTSEAPAGQFVEAAVLRQSDFNAAVPASVLKGIPGSTVADKIANLKGVVVQDTTQALAPTRAFAREVLGTLATPSAQSLSNAGIYASPADLVGSFGLQSIYQRQLAGRPAGKVLLVDKATGKTVVATLATFTAVAGLPVHTTLDTKIQEAADDALTLSGENTSIVAIDVRNGDVLAVANGPATSAGDDRALNGRYAPGSVFKIITTTALLKAALVKTDDTVPCPSTITVNGKQFSNYDELGSLGAVSFERDFEESCNTAFIGSAGRLTNDALSDAAALYGMRNDWNLGVPSYSGDVPPANSPEEQAADAIGQGRVQMSPLAMAVVAAGVADGTPHTPQLVLDGPPVDPPAGTATAMPTSALPPTPKVLAPLADAQTLQQLMVDTVKYGTAKGIAIKGADIGAKTGTAQYGSDTNPGNHAWMVGFMGDIAFAVIVEHGVSGAVTAGPLARQFLGEIKDYAQNLPKRPTS